MSRTRWIAVFVIAVVAGSYFLHGAAQKGIARNHVGPAPVEARPTKAVVPAAARPASSSGADTAKSASSRDYAAAYRDAQDLLAFLKSLAPAAETGDANALYWMFRASRRCVRDYMIYFGRPGHERSLETELAERFVDERSAREIHTRCAAFKAANDNPYRDWKALLKRASDAGDPIAEATQATEIRRNLISERDPAKLQSMAAEINALARDALRSKDPAVLMELANLSTSEVTRSDQRPGAQNVEPSSVWQLAACQRGFECGADNEDFRYLCALDFACQPFDTLVDMVRRYYPEEFDELELRATELNAKLDAGRFDDIDL